MQQVLHLIINFEWCEMALVLPSSVIDVVCLHMLDKVLQLQGAVDLSIFWSIYCPKLENLINDKYYDIQFFLLCYRISTFYED